MLSPSLQLFFLSPCLTSVRVRGCCCCCQKLWFSRSNHTQRPIPFLPCFFPVFCTQNIPLVIWLSLGRFTQAFHQTAKLFSFVCTSGVFRLLSRFSTFGALASCFSSSSLHGLIFFFLVGRLSSTSRVYTRHTNSIHSLI